MARSNRNDGGSSRRPTRRGTSSGRRPTGAHRTTRSGSSTGRRPTTARGSSVTGRRTTRAGETVRPKNNTPLMLGGLALGVVVIVALVAMIASSGNGEEKKKKSSEAAKLSAADFRPAPAPKPRPAAAPRRETERKPARNLREKKPHKETKPAAFYKGLVDMNLWAEAQRLAATGNKIARDLKNGTTPAGMTKKEAVRKARESLGLALDKGNEFLEPVESRDKYEDVDHFTRTYNDTLLRWSRQMRSISFGGGQ